MALAGGRFVPRNHPFVTVDRRRRAGAAQVESGAAGTSSRGFHSLRSRRQGRRGPGSRSARASGAKASASV